MWARNVEVLIGLWLCASPSVVGGGAMVAVADYVTGVIGDDPKHFLIENSIFEPVRLAAKPRDDGAGGGLVPLPAGRRVVIYAGTFERYQGLDILVAAFARVVAEVPDALLLMVGGDPEQVDAMRRLAGEHGIAEAVVFTGRVPQAQAKRYNELAAVLTSPRSAGTNTPLKVYEQLASGKPLVATRIYSHTQVLSDETCILVEPEPGDMARGIVAALADDESVRARVAKARALYEEAYSRPAYVRKLSQVLERLA